MRKRILAVSLVGGLVAFALAVVPAYAQTGDGTGGGTGGGHSETTSTEKTSREQKLEERRNKLHEAAVERKHERLEAAKLKVCEQREARINAIMAKRVTQAEKHLAVFTKISDRVKTFYTDKGLTVANYDALVAAVDDAKVNAEATLAELKEADTFKCDIEDPKAVAEDFKTFHKQLREDLKAYRTAIKDLIVAVKSAQSEGESNEGEE